MIHSLTYDTEKSQIVLGSRLWSDFGAHIPLVRSFSQGANWPPEYPLFPGEKIRYHFLFYAIAGVLERAGVRFDWAVNIPSIIGFFSLLVLIYSVSVFLFQRKTVGIMAILFFLFNGTLSFLKFFATHPPLDQPATANALFHLMNYPSFGPWDGSLVTAFWNLNIYTNQRHVALSFAVVLGAFLLLVRHKKDRKPKAYYRKKTPVAIIKWCLSRIFFLPYTKSDYRVGVAVGLSAGMLFFLNQAALFVLTIYCIYLFLTWKKTRLPLILSFLVSLPFLLFFFAIAQPGGTPHIEPGYLSAKPFAWPTFIIFWVHNLGLHLFLIPLGMILAPKRIRFVCIPLLILFIAPNVFQFSVDMINNHKFFSFFIIIGGMYSAYALVRLWELRKKLPKLFSPLIFLLLSTVSFFLTLSGFIDFFVIKNDYYLYLQDMPINLDAQFIATHIPKKAVVLNSTWFYHPASLAGRPIYNGYSFFTWSAGYTTYQREAVAKQIYRADNIQEICTLLARENISYVELNRQPEGFLKPISPVWESLPFMYRNEVSGVTLYDRDSICQ